MLPAQLSALSAQQVLLKSREMGNLSQNQQHHMIKKVMINLINEFNTSFPRELLSLQLLLWGQTLGGQFLRRFTQRL